MSRNNPARKPDPLHDPESAKTYVGANSTRTLERWRMTDDGPEFVKVGHLVRYRQSALDRWLRQRTRRHTNKQP